MMYYARIKNCDIANGVGVRVSLFVSVCTHHCKHCFNQEAWDFTYGEPFSEEIQKKLIDLLEPSYIHGLSLLGGEPMEPSNQEALLPFIKKVKEIYPDKTIWCYTGYLFDKEIRDTMFSKYPYTKELVSYFDVMVDGKYVEKLKDLNLRFRGSSNQRIIDVKKSLTSNTLVLWNN